MPNFPGLSFRQAVSNVLLLDEVPTAYVGYSVRKLRSAYSGYCMKVRRSSDNATQDIGFVNNMLDTASLLTFCGAGNGFVDTLYNQSGSGAPNAVQATAAGQPQIVTSGVVGTVNGKPTLLFTTAREMLFTATVLQPRTLVAMTGRTSAYTTLNRIIFTGGTNGQIGFTTTPNQLSSYSGVALTGVSVDGSLNSIQAYQSGANSILYVNGVRTTGNVGTSNWNALPISLGDISASGLRGYISEAVVYGRTLNDTNLLAIYNNQKQYFGTI